jgi:hypothetical protein
MFTCEACRREGNIKEWLRFPWEIRRHLKSEHGIPIRKQYIEGWNETFQEQYLKNRNKPEQYIDDRIVVIEKRSKKKC